MFWRTIGAVTIAIALASSAGGMIIDASGNVVDWGLTPFTLPNQANMEIGDTWGTVADDYAPLNYPGGIGYHPSPGGATGEKTDLEEMYVRHTGDLLQVLVVTSSGLATTIGGVDYRLGDLFLDVEGQRYGLVTQNANQGLDAGSLYRIQGDADVQILQDVSRSYYGSTVLVQNDYGPPATIPQIAGPWAVAAGIDPAQWLGATSIASATYNYGGDEDGTFLVEYSVDTGLFDRWDDAVMAHIAWGCGNDVIRTEAVFPHNVPEPATFGLVATGGLFWIAARRRR